MKRVAVVGGGASGLAAAISAARAGAEVELFERDARVGKPVLKTGNGRCNLTNARVAARDYNDPGFVAPLLERWDAAAVRTWFAELGLLTCEEREGRVYPRSNAAATVVDVLRAACAAAGVRERVNAEVEGVRCPDGAEVRAIGCPGGEGDAGTECGGGAAARCDEGDDARRDGRAPRFSLELDGGEAAGGFDAVVVAVGGGVGARLLEGCGHALVSASPVLCSLACETRPLKGLDGVRVRCVVGAFHPGEPAPFAREAGEVLFRGYGVSGIVVFNMSRLVEPGDALSLDLLPEMGEEELADLIACRAQRLGADWGANGGASGEMGAGASGGAAKGTDGRRVVAGDLMCGIFAARVNDAVVRMAGFSPDTALSRMSRTDRPWERIAHAAKDFRLSVKGVGDAKRAQVTRGGARTDEFDVRTMASRLHPGLFACGEVLDVDGPCGGWNLHWAWASGIAAGTSAAACR